MFRMNGENLKLLRQAAGVAQMKIVKRTGIPQSTLSYIEVNRLPLTREQQRKVLDALGMDDKTAEKVVRFIEKVRKNVPQ